VPFIESYEEHKAIEQGIIQTMHSKYIDHISIKFKGIRKSRMLILKRRGEVA